MKSRTMHLRIAQGGALLIVPAPSAEPTGITLEGVPEAVSNAEAVKRLSRIMFVPWPKAVAWDVIANAGPGRIFRPGDCATLETEGRLRL
jgi:hypothetical protein